MISYWKSSRHWKLKRPFSPCPRKNHRPTPLFAPQTLPKKLHPWTSLHTTVNQLLCFQYMVVGALAVTGLLVSTDATDRWSFSESNWPVADIRIVRPDTRVSVNRGDPFLAVVPWRTGIRDRTLTEAPQGVGRRGMVSDAAQVIGRYLTRWRTPGLVMALSSSRPVRTGGPGRGRAGRPRRGRAQPQQPGTANRHQPRRHHRSDSVRGHWASLRALGNTRRHSAADPSGAASSEPHNMDRRFDGADYEMISDYVRVGNVVPSENNFVDFKEVGDMMVSPQTIREDWRSSSVQDASFWKDVPDADMSKLSLTNHRSTHQSGTPDVTTPLLLARDGDWRYATNNERKLRPAKGHRPKRPKHSVKNMKANIHHHFRDFERPSYKKTVHPLFKLFRHISKKHKKLIRSFQRHPVYHNNNRPPMYRVRPTKNMKHHRQSPVTKYKHRLTQKNTKRPCEHRDVEHLSFQNKPPKKYSYTTHRPTKEGYGPPKTYTIYRGSSRFTPAHTNSGHTSSAASYPTFKQMSAPVYVPASFKAPSRHRHAPIQHWPQKPKSTIEARNASPFNNTSVSSRWDSEELDPLSRTETGGMPPHPDVEESEVKWEAVGGWANSDTAHKRQGRTLLLDGDDMVRNLTNSNDSTSEITEDDNSIKSKGTLEPQTLVAGVRDLQMATSASTDDRTTVTVRGETSRHAKSLLHTMAGLAGEDKTLWNEVLKLDGEDPGAWEGILHFSSRLGEIAPDEASYSNTERRPRRSTDVLSSTSWSSVDGPERLDHIERAVREKWKVQERHNLPGAFPSWKKMGQLSLPGRFRRQATERRQWESSIGRTQHNGVTLFQSINFRGNQTQQEKSAEPDMTLSQAKVSSSGDFGKVSNSLRQRQFNAEGVQKRNAINYSVSKHFDTQGRRPVDKGSPRITTGNALDVNELTNTRNPLHKTHFWSTEPGKWRQHSLTI